MPRQNKAVKNKKTKAEKVKGIIPPLPDGQMTHLQMISQERELTTTELVTAGNDLAQEELQLVQVRNEKKETNREFDNTIKDHLGNIIRLSNAINTGIMTTNLECDVVIDREKEKKTCYPKDGSEPFILPMTPDDFDLLT